MSRKAILLLIGLYFLGAVAFSVFHVAANPFLPGLNAAAVSKALGGAVLLFGGAGLLPLAAFGLKTRHNIRLVGDRVDLSNW